jgi:hypothetical protein
MKNRSRKRLLTVRAPRNTDQGSRIRKLFGSFMAKLDAKDAKHVAMALSAAELTVAAEDARTLLLAGDLAAEQPTVRLENSARRARADLKSILSAEEASKPWDPRSLWSMGVSDDDEEDEATA